MKNAWRIRSARLLLIIVAAATVFALYQALVASGWSGIPYLVAGITGIIASIFLLLENRGGSQERRKKLVAIAFVWCLPVLCISISCTHPAIPDRIFMIAIWIFLMILAVAYTFKKMVLDGLPAVPA